ncbi:MAG: TIGR04141 family sporadically distributed protein [Deltaproteobacteria bacterium]|nr:TIGR04141 family sporadically distributed protein [Deltaproteobacteria bacterium]
MSGNSYSLVVCLLGMPKGTKTSDANWHAAMIKPSRASGAKAFTVAELPGAKLYVTQKPAAPPAWAAYFPTLATSLKKALANSTSAGLLLMPVKNRAVAVCFGHGRHLLDPGRIRESFGLKTTLNLIPHDKVQSIDTVAFDQITRHSRVQTAQQSDVFAFGMNVEQDVLRAVTGQPDDPTFGKRLSGRDAIHLRVKLSGLSELPDLVEKLLAAHREKKYQERFAWIDYIQEVRSPPLVDALEKLLEARIAAKNLSRMWMSAPELLDWERLEGFRYKDGETEPLRPDLKVKEFLDEFWDRAPKPITVPLLRSRRILAYDANGGYAYSPWSAYQCFYFEVEHGGQTYLLSSGRWFRIEKSYVNRVDAYVKKIASSSIKLPSWDPGEKEGAYNARAAAVLGADAQLLDAKNIMIGGGQSRVEFCDIMTLSPRRLVFVKRYGHSSSLSHLFAQAFVSARLLKLDGEFRHLVNGKVPATHAFDVTNPPDTSKIEIVLAIISDSLNPLVLPFFSRVTLMLTHQNLQLMGFQVAQVTVGPKAAP